MISRAFARSPTTGSIIHTTLPTPPPPPPALDVGALLEQSRPSAGSRRIGLLVPVAWMCVFAAAAVRLPAGEQTLISLLAIGVTVAISFVVRAAAGGAARERQTLSQFEDNLALKQIAAALGGLIAMLSRPMRTAEGRLRALILLATALARSDRQDEALQLYDELLDREHLGGPGADVVRVARAMAMLRADRLFDADRAITDLRQRLKRPADLPPPQPKPPADFENEDEAAEPAPEPAMVPLADLEPAAGLTEHGTRLYAGVRLVELYRDVKTGHPDDALASFEVERDALRRGLGHRYAEALALIAAAHDRLGHADEAARAFSDATALAPVVDLIRKYPELAALPSKYAVTPPPPRR